MTPPAPPIDLTELLDRLNYTSAEHLQLCMKAPGGAFTASVPTLPVVTIPQDRDVWFGINPINPSPTGRPGADDVTRVAAAWGDLDIKAGGCPDWEVAAGIVDTLSGLLGVRPVAVTLSGHGLQPIWAVEDGLISGAGLNRDDARALLRRWGRFVRGVAERLGAQVDSVFDLPRILRCPGSVNHKDPAQPRTVVTTGDTGAPITVERLVEVLDENDVADNDSDHESFGATVSAPADWVYRDGRSCRYVPRMVRGWAGDNPTQRHPWFVGQATRIAAAHRYGCFTQGGHDAAVTALVNRFRQLVAGDRGEAPGEVTDALVWGVQKAAGLTDARVRQELGDHQHHNHEQPIPTPPVTGGENLHLPPDPVVPNTNRLTDDGNSEALITAHGAVIRFCHERGRWLTWTGTRWHVQPANGGDIRELVKSVARGLPTDRDTLMWRNKSLSAMGTTNTVTQATTDRRVAVSIKDLDNDPWALNTPAGAVDLRTGEIRPSNPAALHTRITAVPPDDKADTSEWERFLLVTFNDDKELIGYLQRLVGYSATGHIGPHVLPFAYGSGSNGKGVFLESISKVLGDYATSAPNSFLMARQFAQHETEIARLAGARMVLCSEVNETDRFDEAKVKQLTGGDTLTARFMRQDHFTFTPSHHLWLLGNHQPAVKSGGHSFWRRCRLIPFDHQVSESEQIDDLQGKFAAEHGPAILAWIIRGAVDYCDGGLREPASVVQATAGYAHDQDTVGRFVDECCHLSGAAVVKVPARDLINAYEQWCAEVGETAVTAKRFGTDLRVRFKVGDVRSHGRRFYTGISLLTVRDDDQ